MRSFLVRAFWFLVRFFYALALTLVGLMMARATYLAGIRWFSETGFWREIASWVETEPDFRHWAVVGRSSLDVPVTLWWLAGAFQFGFVCYLAVHVTPRWRWLSWLRRLGMWCWETFVFRWFFWAILGMIVWPLGLLILHWIFPGVHHWVMNLGPWLGSHILRPVAVALAYALLFAVEFVSTGYMP